MFPTAQKMKHRHKTFPSDVFFSLALQATKSLNFRAHSTRTSLQRFDTFSSTLVICKRTRRRCFHFSATPTPSRCVHRAIYSAASGYSRDHHHLWKFRDFVEVTQFGVTTKAQLIRPYSTIPEVGTAKKISIWITNSCASRHFHQRISRTKDPNHKDNTSHVFPIEISAIVGWQRN